MYMHVCGNYNFELNSRTDINSNSKLYILQNFKKQT